MKHSIRTLRNFAQNELHGGDLSGYAARDAALVLLGKGSGLSPAFVLASNSASTAALVGSSTQSRRRSTVNGKMTRPYSDCL
jgi:hypothetical protein